MSQCFVVITMFLACLGCRTPSYTAKNLPSQLRVAAAPASKTVNLEQLGGAGVGTSEIGPGDLVQITIVSGSGEERITPVPARVAQDGTVMVPLIGPVPVAGMEPVAAEQRIAAAAVERGIYHHPYVTMRVTEQAVNRITVLGAVGKPGVVELPRGSCDLASALAAAGGLKKEASTQVDVLHRGGGNSFMANQQAVGPRLAAHTDPVHPVGIALGGPDAPVARTRIDLAQADAVPPEARRLQDRDVVMVLPEENRVIHVTGLVRKPSQFQVSPSHDVRVLDAIAMAGGPTSPVADKVIVIRQLPDMAEPAVIKVSMSSAKGNGNDNLLLAAGDLVSVESTPATMFVDTATKFFRMSLGLSGRLATF